MTKQEYEKLLADQLLTKVKIIANRNKRFAMINTEINQLKVEIQKEVNNIVENFKKIKLD
jgi:hypothetical protein